MAMNDIGLKIEMAVTAGSTVPVAEWRTLKDCTAVPALVQPSSKIPTDYVGDEFTGELLGKKSTAALDFTFAYDGTASGNQYKFLAQRDTANEQSWLRVTYPDGTAFEMLANIEVSLMAVTPSAQLEYIMSVVPVRQSIASGGVNDELVHIVMDGETDVLETEVTLTIVGADEVAEEGTILLAAVLNVGAGTILWSSSDEAIATVSSGGVVTGVLAGTATITATLEGSPSVTDTFDVTVTE